MSSDRGEDEEKDYARNVPGSQVDPLIMAW